MLLLLLLLAVCRCLCVPWRRAQAGCGGRVQQVWRRWCE